MLQFSASFCSEPLTHIINYSFEKGYFPMSWREAVVRPIPKTTNPVTYADYRPISLLSTASKIAESILHGQMIEYLEDQNILPPIQSGFRSGHSTSTALLQVLDDIVTSHRSHSTTALVLLDMSKAFDSVNFECILAKLEYYGIRNQMLNWFRHYLSGRTFRTRVDGVCSSRLVNVSSGVLGPLLFNVVTSDLPEKLANCTCHMYADDVQIYTPIYGDDIEEGIIAINEDLTRIFNWASSNSLQLNPVKCQVVLVGGRDSAMRVRDSLSKINLNGTALPIVETARNLGVILDSNLSFEAHVDKLCQRSYAKLKLLYQFKHLLPTDVKLLISDSLILSAVSYADVVYGPFITQSAKRRLQSIQYSCLAYATGCPRRQHMSEVLRGAGWLRMEERRFIHYVGVVRSAVVDGQPCYLAQKIRLREEAHGRNLRHVSTTASVPQHRTAFFRKSFSYLASHIINTVLNSIGFKSKQTVSRCLKESLINRELQPENLY